jgi:hypothetical protein
MKILCSGNSDHKTIASGVVQIYNKSNYFLGIGFSNLLM